MSNFLKNSVYCEKRNEISFTIKLFKNQNHHSVFDSDSHPPDLEIYSWQNFVISVVGEIDDLHKNDKSYNIRTILFVEKTKFYPNLMILQLNLDFFYTILIHNF